MYSYVLKYGNTAHNCNSQEVGGEWSLRASQPEKCADFRSEFVGTLTFLGRSYEFLKNIETTDKYGVVAVEIYKDGLFWEGTFAIISTTFDHYKGFCSVNPIVEDEYSELLRRWQDKTDIDGRTGERLNTFVNWLSGVEFHEVEVNNVIMWFDTPPLTLSQPFGLIGRWNYLYNIEGATNDSFQAKHQLSTGFGSFFLGYWLPCAVNSLGNDVAINQFFRSVGGSFAFVGGTPFNLFWQKMWLLRGFTVKNYAFDAPSGTWRATVNMLFIRQSRVTINNIINVPQPPNADTVESNGVDVPVWDVQYSEPTTVDGKNATKFYRHAASFYKEFNPFFLPQSGAITVNLPVWNNGWTWKMADIFRQTLPARLIPVLEIMASDQIGKQRGYTPAFQPISVESKFLTDTTNPITGLANDLKDCCITQNRRLSGLPYEYNETIGLMSLKDLLTSLCEHFNLLWAVRGDKLQIEHVSYWLNQYTERDLRAVESGIYTKNKIQYTYEIGEIQSKVDMRFSMLADSYDLDGIPILYKPFPTQGAKSDSTKTVSVQAYGVSYDKVHETQEENGFTLLSLEKVGDKYQVKANEGLITGQPYILNEPLSASRCFQNYHKHMQDLSKGIMNSIEQNFEESGYFKEHVISLPIDITEVKKWRRVRTDLGTGRIAHFEYRMKSGVVVLTIIYRADV